MTCVRRSFPECIALGCGGVVGVAGGPTKLIILLKTSGENPTPVWCTDSEGGVSEVPAAAGEVAVELVGLIGKFVVGGVAGGT